ncbi:hypothetical protein DY000_02036278 [Brassica cretica]|uniref:Uncharacterized protein n=1 Tax=Brassica cretica TaxID=69181 RepID=A0ABQ7BKW6_BRACR|nr:hypothetical protein DY000_02036278 [Brassica cretica]
MRHVGRQVRKSVFVRMTPVPFIKTMRFIMQKAIGDILVSSPRPLVYNDGECLRRRFSDNHLGTAGYHHDADFVDVYIIIFSGARYTTNLRSTAASEFLNLSPESEVTWLITRNSPLWIEKDEDDDGGI